MINSQIAPFLALNRICSKSRQSCSKSHHLCSISYHFCFEYKMRGKSLFVSPFLQTGYLINKILVLAEFQTGCNKVVIELRVVQFWSEIILVFSNRTRAARSSDFQITRVISDQIALHSVQLLLLIRQFYRTVRVMPK